METLVLPCQEQFSREAEAGDPLSPYSLIESDVSQLGQVVLHNCL